MCFGICADDRELADGGRVLEVERLEVHRLGLGSADHLHDARQGLALGQIARPRLVHEGAERVVDLHGVDAHVDVRHAEAGCAQQARERRDGVFFVSGAVVDELIQQREDRLGVVRL